jgi:hypothetical protein
VDCRGIHRPPQLICCVTYSADIDWKFHFFCYIFVPENSSGGIGRERHMTTDHKFQTLLDFLRNQNSESLLLRTTWIMATNQGPIPPDSSNAPPGIVGVSFLFAVSLIVYGVRMHTRTHPTFKLTASDYIVSAALVSAESRRLLWSILIFLTDMRINRADQFASGSMPWTWPLRILHFRLYPDQNRAMSVSTGTLWLLGIFPCESIHREHASSL